MKLPSNDLLWPDRRRFLGNLAATAIAAGAMTGGRVLWAEDAKASAAELVRGKDPRLIVHNAKPIELETPLELLRDHRLTPKNLLFVRNNQLLAGSLTTDAPATPDWKVEVDGLVEFPRTFDLRRLEAMEQTEIETVLQCSGNGRAFFSAAAPAKGARWRNGALANVRFGGVKLATLFDALELNIALQARFVTAEGRDAPLAEADADFEHSIPLADALNRSILALRLNGERLPAVHGGPVRLVTPGFYGTMNVKWLSRLRIEDRETFNHHQVRRYRTPLVPIEPGSKFTYDLDNSEPNWGMRVKSVFFTPLDGERLAAGNVALRGVAWNDGTYRVECVEVSADGGQNWQRAEIDRPASPYAWHAWKMVVKLDRGRHELHCRAVDARGRSQPQAGSIDWNPAGYCWSGVETIRVDVG